MKSLATVATLLLAIFGLQPAQAQDPKAPEPGPMVAGRPTLPTTSIKDLIAVQESWGTKPSMSTWQPEKGERSDKMDKTNAGKAGQ